MPRDNFTQPTKSSLAKNVHFRCVYRGCPLVTHASTPYEENINLGHAAHITAASAGGPRFDEDLTPAQRRAYENGAWLCANHATLVDNDPITFPPELLREWQRLMEESARSAVYGAPMGAHFDFSEICSKLELFLKVCRRASFQTYRDPRFVQIPRECVSAMYDLVSQCPKDHWRPVHQWHSLHPTTHSIQVRAVDAIRRIHRELTDFRKWSAEHYGYVILGAANIWSLTPAEDIARMDQTLGVVNEALSEFHECLDHLNEYAAGRRHPANLF